MEVGIIGQQGAGKSTLFHSLTGVRAGISGKIELTRGVALVPDTRVDFIEKTYNSKKRVYTSVEYVDSPPIETGGFRQSSFRQEFLRGMEAADALLVTVPCYLNGQINDAPSVVKDLQTEFILSDMEIIEKRMEKLARDAKRGVKGVQAEVALLERCQLTLEDEIPLRDIDFSSNEQKVLRSFSFLTSKPKLIVLNISEDDLDNRLKIEDEVKGKLDGFNIISICAKLQSEITDLHPEEIPVFMEELGIAESASDKVIKKTRDMLGLITFLTAGDQEAHAWDLRKGSTALEAADTIHSDLARGFIRAEVFHFNDLQKYPSEVVLKANGLIRLEGKEYIVNDGDIIFVRFKV